MRSVEGIQSINMRGYVIDDPAFKETCDKLTETFNASLTSGDTEVAGAISAYGFARVLTFTADKVEPSGNEEYQSTFGDMRDIRSYRLEMTNADSTPAAKAYQGEQVIIKLALPGLSQYEAVQWAVKGGITSAICTRAQIVTFLYRDLAD